ncbi:MAG: nitroreductase [Acidobacteria bacterium]|nr:MAG: nitroreductase [Acidobacteriota bacterium]
MDAIEAIARRRSVKRLHDPAPTEDDLRIMFSAAMAAPDHRTHRPWRFFVLQGESRNRFAEVLVEALRAQDLRAGRTTTEEALKTERTKLERAPIVVIACAVFSEDIKAPRDEQLLAVGCAVQNLLIAATSLGYGTMWRTGEAARDPVVKGALGIDESDEIVGFIYLGTDSETSGEPAARPRAFEFVEWWD